MSKKITLIFRHAPHGSAACREALDFALLSASFEQQISLLFVDEGVLNLLDAQLPELIGGRDFIKTLKALPLYEIDEVYACQDSLAKRGLNQLPASLAVDLLDTNAIKALLSQADEVLVY
ncbi:sulfurtransferase complex subunit TusC [Shewanella sp. AS1]|uniref:sulfurtransferase complex subunit TusC n=1 Tax=Shewanella sp. AS1 TaxID=2907626 RepID=UPI001F426384|nr:sulfurtransferase complex subunit TusC [Shewanella sp. AS1]MCE9678481.1 sulfurtransferase complex subunit TusC [Shewanella sp. AS1]